MKDNPISRTKDDRSTQELVSIALTAEKVRNRDLQPNDRISTDDLT